MGYTDRSSAESSNSERAHLPLYELEETPSLPGKLRYVMFKVTRRQIFFSAFIIIALWVVITSKPGVRTDDQPVHATEDGFSCSSSRQHSKYIRPPLSPDRQVLTDLWNDMQSSFLAHNTTPTHLVKPPGDGHEDTVQAIRELVNITATEAQASRESHAAFVKGIKSYPEGVFGGAGVVTLAGGHYSEYAATTMGMLRETGSMLPAELWIISPDEDLAGWCDELLQEGIACRRLYDYVDVKLLQHPYQYKILTMLLSSFEEIIFIDADSMPLKKVDDLLQSEPYLRTGAILWPDYWESVASPWTPYILGITDERAHRFEDGKTAETGQIVWNKRRHWRSLVLAAYYNYFGPDFYYTLISANYAGWGDKDTFPWALRALGEDYYQFPHDIITVFQVPNSRVEWGHGIGMAQGDPRNNATNSPMFLHNNIIKWSMRDFLCVGCPFLWVDVSKQGFDIKAIFGSGFSAYYTNKENDIYENLHKNMRILKSDGLTKAGLDPEPLIWKAMEHTACRSQAWGNKQVCDLARQHMSETFGFDFRSTLRPTANGFEDVMCVVDPPGIGHVQPDQIESQ